MKRLLLLVIALAAMTSPAWAGGLLIGSGVASGVPTWSCTDANIFCENYSGSTDCGTDAAGATNCSYGYTVTEGTGGVVAFATTPTLSPGGQTGTYVLRLEDNNASLDGVAIVAYTIGSQSEHYTQIYFRVTNARNLVDRESLVFVTTQDTSFCYGIYFQRKATGYQINLKHFSNASTTITSSSDVNTLAVGTWYGVRVYWKSNQTGTGISWAVDYDLDGTFTDQTIATPTTTSRIPNKISQASTSPGNVTEVPITEVDMIKMNAASYPGATIP